MTVITAEGLPIPGSEARAPKQRGLDRRNNDRRRLVGNAGRLADRSEVSARTENLSGETENPEIADPAKIETPLETSGDAVIAEAETAKITAIETAVDDEAARVEAAKTAVIEAKRASAKKAASYAIDREGEKDTNVPVNERFKVTKAMGKSADYHEELKRLVQEVGGKPSKQELHQLQERAARNSYYVRAEAKISETKGEILEAVKSSKVFKTALEREVRRAKERQKPGQSIDAEDIYKRALAEEMAAEDIKKDKSLVTSILKAFAVFGFGSLVSFSSEAEGAITRR